MQGPRTATSVRGETAGPALPARAHAASDEQSVAFAWTSRARRENAGARAALAASVRVSRHDPQSTVPRPRATETVFKPNCPKGPGHLHSSARLAVLRAGWRVQAPWRAGLEAEARREAALDLAGHDRDYVPVFCRTRTSAIGHRFSGPMGAMTRFRVFSSLGWTVSGRKQAARPRYQIFQLPLTAPS